MREIAPGVYTAPTMARAVRERVWRVLSDWFGELGGGGIVTTWREPSAPGRQAVLTLGLPRRELVEVDGLMLVKGELNTGSAPGGSCTSE